MTRKQQQQQHCRSKNNEKRQIYIFWRKKNELPESRCQNRSHYLECHKIFFCLFLIFIEMRKKVYLCKFENINILTVFFNFTIHNFYSFYIFYNFYNFYNFYRISSSLDKVDCGFKSQPWRPIFIPGVKRTDRRDQQFYLNNVLMCCLVLFSKHQFSGQKTTQKTEIRTHVLLNANWHTTDLVVIFRC